MELKNVNTGMGLERGLGCLNKVRSWGGSRKRCLNKKFPRKVLDKNNQGKEGVENSRRSRRSTKNKVFSWSFGKRK